MIDIDLFEQKIIDTLKDSQVFKSVESYQGNIKDLLMKPPPLPAALVLYGGAIPITTNTGGSKWQAWVYFNLFLIGKNLKGKNEAAAEVKVMLQAARRKIHGLKVSDRTMHWYGESLEIVTNTGICAYEQKYQYMDYIYPEKEETNG